MPTFDTRTPSYKPQKKQELKWEGWDGGWNNTFDESEIKPNELVEATNLMLKGKGTVTGRWGSDEYFTAGSGWVRGVAGHYEPEDDLNHLLAITDSGYLVKRNAASYTQINGASWTSGAHVEMAQLGGSTYIVSNTRELIRYDGASVNAYATISTPSNIAVTNLSGVSGTRTYGWRVSAVTDVGETLASDTVQLVNLPQNVEDTLVKVTWNSVSAASGVLKGYTVYRGQPGGETFIASVGADTTEFFDYGADQSDTIFPPNADNTGGPKCKHLLKLDDRIVVAGFEDDPSLVMISARYPYESRFHWVDGGGYVRIAPDDGEKVTGLAIVGSNTKGGSVPATILVFKERSAYALILKTVTIGNFVILDPQYQKLLSVGTLSSKSINEVENDVFFLDRSGIYSVGSEPNFLNEIRSKDISARIREYIRGLSDTDFREAVANYIDHKYILSFPTRKETIIYDYERAAFMGPWKTPFGVTGWLRYYDANNEEKWLASCTDGVVRQFSASLNSDSGTAFRRQAVTRKEDFGDWTVMKIIELFYILARNVKGNVNVTIRGETRNGQTAGLKTFTITGGSSGAAGWGTSQWGAAEWGDSPNAVNVTSEDFIRWSQLYKTVRVTQIEVSSTGVSDNWDLINMRMIAQPLGVGSLSPDTRA